MKGSSLSPRIGTNTSAIHSHAAAGQIEVFTEMKLLGFSATSWQCQCRKKVHFWQPVIKLTGTVERVLMGGSLLQMPMLHFSFVT